LGYGDHEHVRVNAPAIYRSMAFTRFQQNTLPGFKRELMSINIETQLTGYDVEDLGPTVVVVRMTSSTGRDDRSLEREITSRKRNNICAHQPTKMA